MSGGQDEAAEFLANESHHVPAGSNMVDFPDLSPWIQTHGGRAIDILDPKPEQICIEDIAFALSRINRFAGHTEYCVADHSIRVAQLVSDELQLPALLHDAHEALWGFGDIASPAKAIVNHLLRPIAKRFDAVIAERFGFAPELFEHPEIKQADLVMLSTEKVNLMSPTPRSWAELPEPIPQWSPPRFYRYAETDFLWCFHQWSKVK